MWMWIIDKILQALDARRKIKVLVHEAFFIEKEQDLFYFVKVVNLSHQSIFSITHAYVKDGPEEKELINQDRQLPHKLGTSETWETWFPKNIITDQKNIFKNVKIVLSDGKIYGSKKNKKVRPLGFVA